MNQEAYRLGQLVKEAIDLEGLRRLNRVASSGVIKINPKTKPNFAGVSHAILDPAALSKMKEVLSSPVAYRRYLRKTPFAARLDELQKPIMYSPRGGGLRGFAQTDSSLRALTGEQKEFVERMLQAHETVLERQSAGRGSGPFAGHASPAVVLGESNMIASAPAHLRDAYIATMGPYRAMENYAIKRSLPNFEYGKQVIPGSLRRHLVKKIEAESMSPSWKQLADRDRMRRVADKRWWRNELLDARREFVPTGDLSQLTEEQREKLRVRPWREGKIELTGGTNLREEGLSE